MFIYIEIMKFLPLPITIEYVKSQQRDLYVLQIFWHFATKHLKLEKFLVNIFWKIKILSHRWSKVKRMTYKT